MPEKNKNTSGTMPSLHSGRGPMGPGARIGREKVKLKDPKITIRRLLGYLKANQKTLVIIFLFCIITACISIFGTRMNGYIVDNFIQTGDILGLARICLIMAVVYLVGVLSTYFQNRWMIRIAQKVSMKIRDDLFKHVQKLSIPYFDSNSGGDLMSRLTNDVDNINIMLSQNITQLFSGVVVIVGMFVAMLLLCPPLLLVSMITLPLMFLQTKVVVKKAQPHFVARQKELGAMNGYIEEHISGQKATILFGREDQVKADFATINERLRRSSIQAQKFSSLMGPTNNLINNLSYFVVTVFGAIFLLNGMDLSIGDIFTFVLYMRGFIQPINQILNTFNTIQSALAGAERVFEVIDENVEEDETIQTTNEISQTNKVEGSIQFDRVDFSYEPEKPILRKIDMHVKKGETIAIVGPTGSGKTTIVNLLTRFYDIDGGAIILDGTSLLKYQKQNLRQNIAMVLQDTFLFSESVRQNIRYGRLDATDKEIEEAAKIANAHHFIMQLPDGYDTVLSDNGDNLSHGQRQLLAIARAVLSRASILILDEATSSIDTRTEIHIQEAMLELMKGKTTFIIAHRLSTIRKADQILVLENGQIMESGTHDELMQRNGAYASLCKTQYQGIAI